MKYILDSGLSRFVSKVEVNEVTGCWLWTAYTNAKGYGYFRNSLQKTQQAHRYSYEYFVEEIQPGFHIDHLCKNPSCVNPAHLEAVLPIENARRGDAGKVARERILSKTHCPSGHPYSKENTFFTKEGYRKCRECGRLRCQRRRDALK